MKRIEKNSSTSIKNSAAVSGNKVQGERVGFIIFIMYLAFEYLRPQDIMFTPLARLKVPMLLTIGLFIIFLKSDKSVLKDKLAIYAGLFVFYIGFTVVYAVNTYYVWNAFLGMSIILIAAIFTMPAIVKSYEMFKKFLYIWVVINTVLALYVISHGGHGPGGFLWDENDVALALNMGVAPAYYLSLSKNIEKKHKILFLLAVLIIVTGVVATMSRGGFLGLVSVFVCTWFLSENRFKSLIIALAIFLVMAYPVYKLLPEQFTQEVSSISDTQDETRNQRLFFWGLGWDMFLDNPVFGVGARNYPWNVASYQIKRKDYYSDTSTLVGGREVHSLYFSLLPELGAIGVIIFSLILLVLLKKLLYIRSVGEKAGDTYSDFVLISKAFIVTTIAFLVTGIFISVLYYPPFWYLVGFSVTLYKIACEIDSGVTSSGRLKKMAESAENKERGRGADYRKFGLAPKSKLK